VFREKGKRPGYEFASDAFALFSKGEDGRVMMTGYSGVPKYVGTVVPEVEQPVRMAKRLKKQVEEKKQVAG
jgi:hypothetical protein